jgi:hypothetical protein
MNIPCEQCPILAICRLKGFGKLIAECSIILKLLYTDRLDDNHIFRFQSDNYPVVVDELQRILKPVEWDLKMKFRKYYPFGK